MIFMTGHISNEFKYFIKKHFPSLTDDFCYDDIPAFKQDNNLEGVRAICENRLEILNARLKEEIEREAETRPVIVFNKNQDKDFIDSIQLPYGVLKKVVDSDL